MFSSRAKSAIPRLVRLNSSRIQPTIATGVPAASPMPSKSMPPMAPAPPQAPNRVEVWSTMQRPRPTPASSPLFEQTEMSLQPMPLSAMQMVSEDPIRLSQKRIAECDGGGGPLGHPKIFINLDKPGPKPCGYVIGLYVTPSLIGHLLGPWIFLDIAEFGSSWTTVTATMAIDFDGG